MKIAFLLSLSFLTISLFYGCQKEEQASMPIISTTAVTNITVVSMTSGGNITSDGGATVTSRGLYWGTTVNPTSSDSTTNDGDGVGQFISNITSLTSYKVYHIRAFAINSVGTAYGADILFSTGGKIIDYESNVSDYEGNEYRVVKIGTQVWMADNLKTTKYNDGEVIPIVKDNIVWNALTSPAYCWYNNNEAVYKPAYGALYNKYAAYSDKLCPTGWHVSSLAEWTVLTNYLNLGEEKNVAGSKMKEAGSTHWQSPNEATNESGFAALPSGIREFWPDGTSFRGIYTEGHWWNSTVPSDIYNSSEWVQLQYNMANFNIFSGVNTENAGMSIRCIKD